jgi:hemerythrin-like domain-containing protein
MTKPVAAGPGSSDEHADPVLQLLVNLTREGSVVAAFQSTHDKFHRYHAEFLRLAPSAPFDERAYDELLQTLDDYAVLFTEHHHAEDNYFFPALREAEPALDRIVDQLVEQHEQLAAQLDAVLERVRGVRSGRAEQDHAVLLVEGLAALQRIVDEHLLFEETATVPVLRTWKNWPV